MTAALQFEAASPLLEWLPGETLFSLASRHDRLWGYASSWRATVLLFGGRHAGTHHDFPNALGEFATRTEGVFGDAGRIARERTLLKYYRPFFGADDVAAAAETMQGATVAHLKFRLGLLTSRFRANHPLKACRSCMRADHSERGWVYWHLEHQYPGVWACTCHDELLLAASVKSTGVERFLWHLPKEDALKEAVRSTCPKPEAFASLAALTAALVGRQALDGWLEPALVQVTLRKRLAERGWTTSQGNIRLAEAANDYQKHCAPLRASQEFVALPKDLDEAKVQLGRLLRPLRSGTHPLRLLVAINWLFASADDFTAAHDSQFVRASSSTTDDALSDQRDASTVLPERSENLLQLLKSGQSATAAAKSVGINVATAMAWAAKAGISVARRPKLLKDEVRSSLVSDLRGGMDKVDAAGRHGVSIETVNRVLGTEIGLQSAWRLARVDRSRRSAREAWLALIASHSALGTKLIRAMNPAVYAWLYRNDRTWLTQHAAGERNHAESIRTGSVRWDERDSDLSRAVQRAVLRLSLENPAKPMRLWQIYQAVPDLKPKLSVLERLPLTKRVLEHALRQTSTRADPANLLD